LKLPRTDFGMPVLAVETTTTSRIGLSLSYFTLDPNPSFTVDAATLNNSSVFEAI